MGNGIFSAAIKKLRADHHLTQGEFADLLGITRAGVTWWELGRSIPNKEILDKICAIFKVDFNYLLGDFGLKKHIRIAVLDDIPTDNVSEDLKHIIKYIYYETDRDNADKTYGLIAQDDSMKPLIGKGDIIIVACETPVRTKDTVVIRKYRNKWDCRIMHETEDSFTFTTLNNEYEPFNFLKNSIPDVKGLIVGKVVEIRKSL